MAIDGFAFKMALRMRWAEVDQQGIVFNAYYLTYFDMGIMRVLFNLVSQAEFAQRLRKVKLR